MASKSSSKNNRSAKHAARQQQQQPHAPFDSSANAPVRVYPPDAFRASAVAASPLMQVACKSGVASFALLLSLTRTCCCDHYDCAQMLQTVAEPAPVVGILSASYNSSERAYAFANRLIGRYAFHPSDMAAACAAPKDTTPLLASVHLYFDAAKPCAYLLGVVRPESQCFARDASPADMAAFERERFKVQLLLHTCCNMLFVLQETSRVSPTLLRDVRALASEKQVVLTQLSSSSSASSATSAKGSKKSSSTSVSVNPFAPGRCVPLVLHVVPAPDAVLSASLAPAQSSKTRSAMVTYCKAYEAKITTLCRSLRGGLVGSLRMRDALTATNLSKERRVLSLDPSQCVVVVSNRTASASGQLDARLDELLESLDFSGSDDESNATGPDLDALLAPLDDDDTGMPRAVQYMNRFVDVLLASNGSLAASGPSTAGSSAGTKDAVRVELLPLAHWLKAFHGLVKTLQRIETKRKQDAATAHEQHYQHHQPHIYNSSDFA